jgi:hypothetical protein
MYDKMLTSVGACACLCFGASFDSQVRCIVYCRLT